MCYTKYFSHYFIGKLSCGKIAAGIIVAESAKTGLT